MGDDCESSDQDVLAVAKPFVRGEGKNCKKGRKAQKSRKRAKSSKTRKTRNSSGGSGKSAKIGVFAKIGIFLKNDFSVIFRGKRPILATPEKGDFGPENPPALSCALAGVLL